MRLFLWALLSGAAFVFARHPGSKLPPGRLRRLSDASSPSAVGKTAAAAASNDTLLRSNAPPLLRGRLVSQQGPSSSVFPFWNRPIKVDNMAGMVTPKGYSIEQHDLTTIDGYILANFRIPRSRGSKPPTAEDAFSGGPPVLLVHGISLSSTCWVVNQPDESLAFILADRGYDVWMMNTRGNTFSREHTKYKSSDSRFWAFSADHMALIDLPATIDYILGVTGFKQLAFAGHSQGGGLILMLLSRKDRYNDLISVNIELAPVVFAKYIESPLLVSFFRAANRSAAIGLLPPQQFFFMSPTVQQLMLNGACQVPVTVQSCVMATESMFGVSSHISTEQYKYYWQQWPSATSFWNSLQWSQIYSSPYEPPGIFEYNYGPKYNISRVRAPTVLFRGGRDVLAAPNDTRLTRSILSVAGSLAGDHYLDDYSHMDFIWDSVGAKSRVYALLLDYLKARTPKRAISISGG